MLRHEANLNVFFFDLRTPIGDFRLQIADFGLQIADFAIFLNPNSLTNTNKEHTISNF